MTSKQEQFLEAYQVSRDAVAAYSSVYSVRGLSADRIHERASEILLRHTGDDPENYPIIPTTHITVQSQIRELIKIKNAAFGDKKYNDALNAIKEINKLKNLYNNSDLLDINWNKVKIGFE